MSTAAANTYRHALAALRKVHHHRKASPESWAIVEAQDGVYDRFQPLFSPEHIPQIEEQEVRDFLSFENNQHWSGLDRLGPRICADMDALRDALALLVDENQPLASRFTRAVGMVSYMAQGVASPILHVAYPDTYGIWNGISENGLQVLRLWPAFPRGSTIGEKYEAINATLNRLATDLGIDLWTLDALWWTIGENPERFQLMQPENDFKGLIDNERFQEGHALFLSDIRTRSGKPFNGFNTRQGFLYEDEVKYKERAYFLGREALQLDQWKSWQPGEGRILAAVQAACSPSVSENLLEHRWEGSASPLTRVETDEEIAALEQALYHFMLGGPTDPDALGPRFDAFAAYLRQERLGCKWRFLAYLIFLLDRQHYFPILPNSFDNVLEFYGLSTRLSGHAQWEAYRVLLNVVAELKERLALMGYERPDTIEVQSYLYVVGRALSNASGDTLPDTADVDFDLEILDRIRRAKKRERTGLNGERYVFEQEQERLSEAGYPDLAGRVRLVAAVDSSAGYDILSFEVDGAERHIEVKTTESPRSLDQGFWLSEGERKQALEDESWCLYRVWSIYDDPYHENLGNIARNNTSGWTLNHASWHVTLNRAAL